MARMARAVAPYLPHHIIQRGNRRQRTFFCLDDYRLYVHLMAQCCNRCGVQIWAYCLMPNHVHLIAVPESADGLRRAIAEAHRRYSTEINRREEWTGHLWQGRFASYVMDDRYTLAAARYVELNPVRAGLVQRAEEYPWSSARAHLAGRDDRLARVAPLLERTGQWKSFLGQGDDAEELRSLREHESTGRPLGNDAFVNGLEWMLGRVLKANHPGRPAKAVANEMA